MKSHAVEHAIIIPGNSFPILDNEFDIDGGIPERLGLLDEFDSWTRHGAVCYEDETDIED